VTAMQQIADWLKELGMAGCAERFAEKHIDIGVLRDLTDQDLKDLSVVSIGHRRKMLGAISELAEARTVPPRPPPTSLSKSQDCAERRQLADIAALQLAAKPPVILCQWRRRRSRWGGPCGSVDEVQFAVEKRPREDQA
jgi:hypothetical protein